MIELEVVVTLGKIMSIGTVLTKVKAVKEMTVGTLAILVRVSVHGNFKYIFFFYSIGMKIVITILLFITLIYL